MGSIRVLIIQPNGLFRNALEFFVRSRQPSLNVVGSAAKAEEILSQLQTLRPDVIVLDVCSPEGEGLQDAHLIRENYHDGKILMTSVIERESDCLACIEAGAAGYLHEDASLEDLLKQIHGVAGGETLISPQMTGVLCAQVTKTAEEKRRLQTLNHVHLTVREREVMAYIEKGLSNKDISAQLKIEVQTVKNHVHNILEKLQLHGRKEAARYAVEHRLLIHR